MDTIQPFLDYFSANPGWALVIVFFIAFGEALLIIGLFVPSTVALLGAGALVGLGKLGFWEVFLCTGIGAILGDQVSYWAGRLYGQRLKTLWPLRSYPNLVARGEAFIQRHGGKSIALGRFVPGVKAVVPGIAGMLGMGQTRFALVNFSSGLVWALAHVVPGILIGQGLALAGELSGRLVIVLLALFAVLALAGWIIRLVVGWLWPWVQGVQARIYQWSLTRGEKRWRRLGRVLAPHNPRARSLIIFVLLGFFTLAASLRLLGGVTAPGGAIENIDLSLFRLLQNLRNAPADELMVMTTMMGDTWTLLPLVAVLALALLWRRAPRAAAALMATAVLAKLFIPLVKNWVERPRPIQLFEGAESFSFPSGHATMAMVCFGLFAVVVSAGLGRWSKAVVFATAAAAAAAVAFSRVYLGAHWFSDVAAGLLFGGLFAAGFGVYMAAFPLRRPAPLVMASAGLAALLATGTMVIARDYNAEAALYEIRSPVVLFDEAQWQTGQWASLPGHRVDLAGERDEAFIAQWAGGTDGLAAAFVADGWTLTPSWTWSASLAYLDPSAELKDLLPRPALHQGLKAGLTLIKPIPGNPAERLVIRVWKADFRISGRADGGALHLVSITRDALRARLNLYAIPSVQPAEPAETAEALARLSMAGQVHALAPGGPALIFAAP